MSQNSNQSDRLLSRNEVKELFREHMGIGRDAYYDNFRKYLKFKKYGDKGIVRMPYDIAVGIINQFKDRPKPDDPPIEQLRNFMKLPEKQKNEVAE